ncbi:shikimate dehydrogenase [Flavitalea sp. BT771]|uniref:shikimate dehydrogenase family protein n=1 Tax=Flavitalea sp. BT771 TaxID=3063329 RepID=UPI0026E4428B|nr:shikimate dehydrogenase [Flavitalea sp. BT771]MDO6432147.1 shikimate dehydrogenase [Flavitalea sp. BT771]MDV6221056.1 shikimate dehydrogenase [Flavitalea sp. BT771]
MRIFGLIGFPLSHSFSQKYFTEKFRQLGITDCRYDLYPIEDIAELRTVLRNPGLCGLNVTIPYKQAVLPFLHEKDAVVAAIDACNCIRIVDGVLRGYNTDTVGFEASLVRKLQPHHDRALILGTGGASKAVEYVLRKLGIDYLYVSRNVGYGVLRYEEVTADILRRHKLVINTTPLGMYPKVDECPSLPYEVIGPEHFLFDLVYNPARTLFLRRGEERGALVENGYDMLIGQAEESWRIWTASS